MKFTTRSGSTYEYDPAKAVLVRLEGDHDIRADFGQEMKVLEVLNPVTVGDMAAFKVDVPFDKVNPYTMIRTSTVTKILEA